MEAALHGPTGRIELGPTVLTIGRAPDSQLVTDDSQSSGHHAELRPINQGYTIIGYIILDKGSTNGTFVKGQRLAPNFPHLLKSGDHIRIGHIIFTYEETGPAQVPPTTPAPQAADEAQETPPSVAVAPEPVVILSSPVAVPSTPVAPLPSDAESVASSSTDAEPATSPPPPKPTEPPKAVEVFYSYAHEDETLRNELDKHLSFLKHEGLINSWYDHNIAAGEEKTQQINAHLNTAHLILLLISPDFIASNNLYEVQMQRAIERQRIGEAYVVPVLLRPVDYKGTPFSKLKVLPSDERPVTSWPNSDEAFYNIARGIRQAVRELTKTATTLQQPHSFSQANLPVPPARNNKQELAEGQAHYKAGRYKEALASFEQAIQIDHISERAYHGKGDALRRLNRYEEALTALERAIQLDPNLAMAYFSKGQLLARLNRPAEALTALDHAIQLDPINAATVYVGKAELLMLLNRNQEALAAYEQALQTDRNFAPAYNGKGCVLLKFNRPQEAVLAFEQAIRLAPNFALAYLNMSNALRRSGRIREAMQAASMGKQLTTGQR